MAIIVEGETPCAICGGGLTTPYTAVGGMAFMPDHRLFRYCDAPLHFSCLENWASREEFAEGYFELLRREHLRGNGQVLLEGDDWLLVCGSAKPSRRPYYAQVALRLWPSRLYSRFERWDRFVAGDYRSAVKGRALKAAEAAMVEIIEEVPDFDVLEDLLEDARAKSR